MIIKKYLPLPHPMSGPVAYFSAEIGLRSDLHTYSGGLGVLAGDHVKSAADAGMDFVAVTLLYHQGYGRQHLDDSGEQSETYPEFDFSEHLEDSGLDLALPLDGVTLHSRIWSLTHEGHGGSSVDVIFLDTRHPDNSPEHAALASRLYGGDNSTRLRQEYLLGVGGLRALKLLGHWPLAGVHLNEGHCTFAALELLRQGWSRERLRASSLFTTHTPLPAGHDIFEWSEVEQVLGDLLPEDARRFEGCEQSCSMSHLAAGLCGRINAVSNLNAYVASSMFKAKHIEPITNGVHHLTWTSQPFAELYDMQLSGWRKDPATLAYAGRIDDVSLASARSASRKVLRELIAAVSGAEFSESALTIGFARRFATYKRADLVFSDLARLRSFAGGRIQFVFAGKAHPKDMGGKQLIKSIFCAARELEGEIPVVFLEDYSMDTGMAMTSGVDVWLNTPVRPMEASGTSGMKAAMNGVPNLSILDGWWPEACEHGVNGWAIGTATDDRDDVRDAASLYAILEEHVLPAWEAGWDSWAHLVRASIATSSRFSGARMLSDYARIYDTFDSQ